MNVVALLLNDLERAELLASALHSPSVSPLIHTSTESLHRCINHERVDAVIIDNELPGFLSGVEILQRLYRDLLRPKTVLIGSLSPADRELARTVGVDVVVRPDVRLSEVAELTRARLDAAKCGQLPLPLEARRLVAAVEIMGPTPQLLVKLVRYLDIGTASIKDLARDVSVDARTTVELLKLTNSAACGLSRKVSSIPDAVSLLGIHRTVQLIVSASVMATQKNLLKGLPEDVSRRYQKRSVLIASVAAAFAESLEDVSFETAHVLGLLQDIGILVLASSYGDRYLRLLERVNSIGHLQLAGSERQTFGITHADVSAALLQKWEMPTSFVHRVRAHHDPEPHAGESTVERGFCRAMQVGEAMADCVDFPSIQRGHLLNRLLQQYGAEEAETCKICLQKSVKASSDLSELFAIPVPEPAAMSVLVREIQEALGPEAPSSRQLSGSTAP